MTAEAVIELRQVERHYLQGQKKLTILSGTDFSLSRGEMVALHPRLEPFFRGMVRHGLVAAIEDHVGLYNHFHGEMGLDPHKSYGYLVHADVASLIGDWLLEA